MRKSLIIVVLVLLAGAMIVGLAGCIPADEAAARRASAEAVAASARADETRAQAEAYQQRQAADTAAAAERYAIRQAERDAAHQRAVEMLPYLVAIIGALMLASLGGLLFWDLRRQPPRPAVDPALLLLLSQQQQLQAGQRELWHALSVAQRQQAIGPGVIIYRDRD